MHYHEGERYFLEPLLSSHHTYFQYWEQMKGVAPMDRPLHALWGDGSEVSHDELYELAAHYRKYEILVAYEPGDIFFLDNIKFKHGRLPYLGPREAGALLGQRVRRQTAPPKNVD